MTTGPCLESLEQRLLLSAVIAQAGFNDGAGMNANGELDSPYAIGDVLIGQGSDEPGWAAPWTSGFSRATVQGTTTSEGDGAISFPSDGDFVTRRLSVAQTGQFTLDFDVRFNAGGSGDVRLWHDLENESIDAGVGPTVLFNSNGTITVRDGQGGGNELTGLAWTANQWHHVQIIADASTLSWRFIFNGNEYIGPDPLGFLQVEPLMNAVFFYMSNSQVDDVKITGAPLAPFGPDNLLMANTDFVSEYTLAGELVQQFSIQTPDQVRADAMDLDIDHTGRVHIFNERGGVGYLSTFTPTTGAWEHHTFPQWYMHNVTYYGGIAVTDQYVYAPDSGSGGDPGGVIRLNLDDLSDIVRLDTALLPHYVALGLDGFLYLLDSQGNVAKYDADSFALIEQYTVQFSHGSSVTSIAIDSNGDIYTSDLDNNIYRHDNDGNLLDTLDELHTGIGLNIRADGTIISGSGGNFVRVADRSLDSSTLFQVHDNGDFNAHFVAFTVPLIPSDLPVEPVDFLPRQDFLISDPFPHDAVVGDFNNDGKVDVAMIEGGFIGVRFNTTPMGSQTITFGEPAFYATGTGPEGLHVADFNQDGKLDLFVMNDHFNFDSYGIYINQTPTGSATPSFQLMQEIGLNDAGISGGTGVGDLNRDSRPDVAIFRGSTEGSSEVATALNLTAGGSSTASFTPVVFTPGGYRSQYATIADLNGDNIPDLISTNLFQDSVTVWINKTPVGASSPTLLDAQTFFIGSDREIMAADINGDGTRELIFSDAGTNFVYVALNTTPDGSNTISFAQRQAFEMDYDVNYTRAADVNGDGKLDILAVVGHPTNAMFVLLNQTPVGSTTLSFVESEGFATDRETEEIVVADFNGGLPDVLIVNHYDSFSILVNTGIAPTTVSVAALDDTASESDGLPNPGTFRISRSGDTAASLTVAFSLTGTAASGSDYTAITSPVVIPAGESFIDITVAAIDDSETEASESVTLTLSASADYAVGTGAATVTIIDDDLPLVSIVALDGAASEAGANTGAFRISRDGSTASELSVSFTVTGSAASGVDYNKLPATVIIPSGQSFVDLIITPIDDAAPEASETVIITLAPGVDYSLATDMEATVTIADNDDTLTTTPGITIEALDDEATEDGESGTLRLSRTGSVSAGLSVKIIRSGNAGFGPTRDYTLAVGGVNFNSSAVFFPPGASTVDIIVTATDDAVFESAEEVILELGSGVGYTLPPVQERSASVSILDNEMRTLSINDVTVREGDTGTTDALFTVSLSGPSGHTITVDYETTPGTAVEGEDYEAALGTLTFLPGEIRKTIPIAISGDGVDQDDVVTFFVNLSNATNAHIGDAQGAGLIRDDDAPPVITIDDVAVSETDGAEVDAVFTLLLSAPSERTITVVAATGNARGKPATRATAGSDYTALQSTIVTFNPGETEATVTVTTFADDLAEYDEKFAVNLTQAVNARIADKQGVGTIIDDDAPSVSVSDALVTEGDRGRTNSEFTVSLSGESTVPVTVKFSTIAGTAAARTDFSPLNGRTIKFAPGETSKVINVAVRGDKLDEPDEAFSVALSAPLGATLGDADGAGSILDDDATPSLSVGDVTTGEGDSGSKEIRFIVRLSAASGQVVTVDFTTADGSAVDGSDYLAISGTLTFNPGVTSQIVTVTVNGDIDPENNENFTLELSNPTNATLADGTGTATISSEEFAPVTINALTLAAVIASGKAPLATTGNFTLTVSPDDTTFAITGDGINVSDSTGTLTYLRTSKKKGKITFFDDVLGAAGSIILTFTSAESANYTMTVAGGSQKGAMTLA